MAELYSTDVVLDITEPEESPLNVDSTSKSVVLIRSNGFLNQSNVLGSNVSATTSNETNLNTNSQLEMEANVKTSTLAATLKPEIKNLSGFTEFILRVRDFLKIDMSLDLSTTNVTVNGETSTPQVIREVGFHPKTSNNPRFLKFSFHKQLLSVNGLGVLLQNFAHLARVGFVGKSSSVIDVNNQEVQQLDVPQNVVKEDVIIISATFKNVSDQLTSAIGLPTVAYALRSIPGLKLFYKLNSNTDDVIVDETDNYNATGNVEIVPGRFGNAAYFNGVDSGIFTDYKVNVNENYSVPLWFRTTAKDKDMLLAIDGDASSGYKDSRVVIGINALNNFIFGFGDGVNEYIDSSVSALSYLDDNYHLLSVVYLETSVQLWVGNVMLKELTHSTTVSDGISDLTIGSDIAGNHKYEGHIDHMRLFETGLSSSNIDTLTNEEV